MKPTRLLSGSASRVGVRENVTEEEQIQRSGLAAVDARLAKERKQQQRSVESETGNEVTRINITRIRRQKLCAFF